MPVKGKERKLPLMSAREVEEVKAKIETDNRYLGQLTGDLKGDDELHPEVHLPASQVAEVETGPILKRIERNKKALAAMDPANQRLNGAERQRGERRYAELQAWLAPRMLTVAEMNYFPSASDPLKHANYRKAVDHAVDKDGEHSAEFSERAHEYKRLGRLLWPEDPEKCNLEFIRPNGEKSSGRHFRK